MTETAAVADINLYKAFATLLGDKPFAYHPALARIAGSAKAGLLLNACCHWGFGKTARNNQGWVYLPVNQIYQMTGLSADEQRTARADLMELGLIQAERRGHGRKWYYRVCANQIAQLLGSDDEDLSWEFSPDDGGDEPDQQPTPQDHALYRENPHKNDPALCGENPDKNLPLYRENPDKNSALCGENRDPITVKESVKEESVNPAGAGLVSDQGDQPPTIKNPRAYKALAEFEQRSAGDKAVATACAGFPEDIRDLARTFMKKFRLPTPREKGFWIQGLRDLVYIGITVSDLEDAFDHMQKNQLIIKSPASMAAVSWEIHQKRTTKPSSTPAVQTYGAEWSAFGF